TLWGPPLPVATFKGQETVTAWFKTESQNFAGATLRLQESLAQLDNAAPQTIATARQTLVQCRLYYKRIEFFLEYFFQSAATIYNGPPKYEIEEPYMEYQTPIGMQVIEGRLFETEAAAHKEELLKEAAAISSSAQDLHALLYGFTANDRQIMESLRLEMVRIYTLGISGFDAPLLKSGVAESYEALSGVQHALAPYLEQHTPHADSVAYYMNGSLQFLQSGAAFDAFDRLRFLSRYALPLQRNLGALIREMQLETQSLPAVLNYDADHLFSKDAINMPGAPPANADMIALGKALFYEPALSGNNKISCATCHQPDLHFTDALPKSRAFDGHSQVQRNAPSLLYAGYQYAQFWDARDSSIEMQVIDVMSNPFEMNADHRIMIQRLQEREQYRRLFSRIFSNTTDSTISVARIASAIAAFVRTLNPRNAPFDRYMDGDTTALSSAQARGFNVFMGKAQCGACHFAPLFNGLMPPLYNFTELEVLGTPLTDDLLHPQADTDSGRYKVFPIAYYNGAFKTPTVRNVSATAPYMHNGGFHTLEAVVEFYNKGGGSGIGLHTEQQTLSGVPLNLTKNEVSDIVSFLHALEDTIPSHYKQQVSYK
ncbi:MAG TPA: cytochrome c peroxidase, partial [Chitinophaga sp.]